MPHVLFLLETWNPLYFWSQYLHSRGHKPFCLLSYHTPTNVFPILPQFLYIYIYVCMYIIHTHHPCCWTAHHLIENKTEDYHYPCRGVLSTRWNQLLLLCSRSCWLSGYSVFVTKFCFNIGLQLQTSLLIIFRPCLWYPYLTLANLFSTFLPCLSHLFCKTRENVSLFRFHSTSNCKQAGELLPIASFFHPSSSMFFFSFLCFEKQIKDSPRSLHQIG